MYIDIRPFPSFMSPVMFSWILVQSLLTLPGAVRDGSEFHSVLREDEMSRSVPGEVNQAVRRAQGMAASRLKQLKDSIAEHSQKEDDAKKAEEKRKQHIEELENREAHLKAQEERAHQALVALEQSTVANTTSSQDYEQALAAFEGVREEVRQMSEDVDKAERTMLEKQQSMEQDLAEKKRLLADKEASLDAAEKTKEAKRAEAEEAGQLVDKHKSAHEEADSALHAARVALEDQQMLRDEAIASHDIAKAEVIEAAKQKEELEKKHRREQDSLELLRKVKREIEDFYKDTDALQASVAKEETRNPEVPAHELLAQSPKLKPALASYNDVVKAFLEVFFLEPDHHLYGTIQPAVVQIKRNSWQEILAVCDPGEEMEKEAEKKNNFDELQEKCGTGLWKVVGLSRLSFPTYNGASEQVEEWWDGVGEAEHVEEYAVSSSEPEGSMEAVATQPTTSKEDPLSETSSMSAPVQVQSVSDTPGDLDLHSVENVEDTLSLPKVEADTLKVQPVSEHMQDLLPDS